MSRLALALSCCVAAASAYSVGAQTAAAQPAAASRQTEADAYTRYELLAPGSGKFRIIYDVTATTAGATYYFNPIRTGSIATDEHVTDRATGTPLVFVNEARVSPGRPSEDDIDALPSDNLSISLQLEAFAWRENP